MCLCTHDVLEECNVKLATSEQKGWCHSEYGSEGARQMRRVRESRSKSRFSQTRSPHCFLGRRAEAAPQNKATHRHAGPLTKAVRQLAG